MEVNDICEWCSLNGLFINFDKTKYMVFHKEKDLSINLEKNTVINVNGYSIIRVFEFKYLGLIFDPCMKFAKHFADVQNKISHRLSYLQGIKRYLNAHVMIIMLNAYVNSVIDYGLDIWAVQSKAQLSQIQGRIDRFIVSFFLPGLVRRSKLCYNSLKSSINIHELWLKCNFLSVSERINYVILKNMYDCYRSEELCFSQRSLDKNMPLVVVPSFQSQIFKNSIVFRGASLWNTLPANWILKNLSYNKFKDLVKEWIIVKRSDEFIYD